MKAEQLDKFLISSESTVVDPPVVNSYGRFTGSD